MDKKAKFVLTKLKSTDDINNIIKKMTFGEKLNVNEQTVVLLLSHLLYQEYIKTENVGFFEFSYYLILNYSLQTKNYLPLLTFSYNNGFYPIAKIILKNNFRDSISNVLLDFTIDRYKTKEGERVIYQTEKQKNIKQSILNSPAKERAYIAPTSFGKSHLIIDDIIKNSSNNKIGIIVPTKALIWQTYRMIKQTAKKYKYKILLFDTDYNKEKRFISIFTQERAARLLQSENTFFDVLYIDEAHNLFESNDRSILLARVIKLNRKLNKNQKVMYLSPLISDVNNIKTSSTVDITSQKIDCSMKEYKIHFLDKNKEFFLFNRFTGQYYSSNIHYNNWLDYLSKNLSDKNFIYFNSPRNIEHFIDVILKTPQKPFNYVGDDSKIIKICETVAKYTIKEYKLISAIKHGIIYIHSKMPEFIKDYLLDKFISCHKLKFIVSNKSILEGMNLPLDSLFILQTYGLDKNSLINLCGRINRFSYIFDDFNHINKLICNIHFIQCEFSGKTDFKNKINLLRSDIEDEVINPLLEKCKINDKKTELIKAVESMYIETYNSRNMKNLLIKHGIMNVYGNNDKVCDIIQNNIDKIDKSETDIIRIISNIFFTNELKNFIVDKEIRRLCQNKAVSFYSFYVKHVYHNEFKNKINYILEYFKRGDASPYYIGYAFGEITSPTDPQNKVYVDITKKTFDEKVNLAIIKSKIEDDMIGVKLSKFVSALRDFSIISQKQFDKFIYGTDDEKILNLMKTGLNKSLIKILLDMKLISEIRIVDNLPIISNEIKNKISTIDDMLKFELDKLFSVN